MISQIPNEVVFIRLKRKAESLNASFSSRQKCLIAAERAFAQFVSCSIQGEDSMLRPERRS